jgi:seryl-tRNA synthetase
MWLCNHPPALHGVAGCGKEESSTQTTYFNHQEVVMTDKRRAFEEKLEARKKEWNAKIDLLKAKADTAKADAKVEYYAKIEALQHKRDKAGTKLQELKAAGDEAWEDLKAGTEKAWDEVKSAFHDAASKFK